MGKKKRVHQVQDEVNEEVVSMQTLSEHAFDDAVALVLTENPDRYITGTLLRKSRWRRFAAKINLSSEEMPELIDFKVGSTECSDFLSLFNNENNFERISGDVSDEIFAEAKLRMKRNVIDQFAERDHHGDVINGLNLSDDALDEAVKGMVDDLMHFYRELFHTKIDTFKLDQGTGLKVVGMSSQTSLNGSLYYK
ncbi:MAG: hypothetical protein EOP06_04420 [Proteobacteria bacterium]|nr:MAG: hypothetical protein EOP06_04420 [Pseudomonadota bacterium]